MSFRQLSFSIVSALLVCAPFVHAASAPPDMQRRVAACITCHGRDGQASNSSYFPRLAGKPAAYLFEQLRSFRDERRHQAEMTHLLANLPDAYLREMAEFFSSRELAYPQPAPYEMPAAQMARGRALVVGGDPARAIPACVECHGQALTGTVPGIPGLLGLPRLYLASQLGAWVTGDRRALPPDCMAEVGRKLTHEDIQAVAGWLAAQPVPANNQPAPAPSGGLPVTCSAMEAHR